jgi:D-glycero-D-manno-heptose 1,7-bisphosphate phosphatase
MLERADAEFNLDRGRSFLVGNRDSDLGAAKTFGIRGFMYEDGDLEAFVKEIVEG